MDNNTQQQQTPQSRRSKAEKEAVARRAALDQRLEFRVKQIGQERMAAFRKQRAKRLEAESS